MSSADIVYPLLIAVGCIGLAVVVHMLTRPKPSRSDIAVPDNDPIPAPILQAGELGEWHRAHEDALANFVEAIDEAAELPDDEADDASPSLGTAHGAPQPETDPAAGPNTEALQDAIASHPSAEMQGELAALRAAALALVEANERDDEIAYERYMPVYLEYRHAWVERMWQFCTNRERVGRLRERS